MFMRIMMVAVIAGALSGGMITGVQMVWSVPLIIAAEVYEEAASSAPVLHQHADGMVHDHQSQPIVQADGHDHDHGNAWAPENGLERTAWTAVANILLGVGGGLVITALLALLKTPVTWRTGSMFGLAAFASVSLAPAIGLPPELPGMAAADLAGRQLWWGGAALATALSLATIIFAPKQWMKYAALALLVLPHLIGAPAPASHETAVPGGLIREFIFASLATAAVFWLGLGSLTGFLAAKLGLKEAAAETV